MVTIFEKLSTLINQLEDNCYDLRCEDIPNGEDCEIEWVVYSHHGAEPILRREGSGETVLIALKDAFN